MSAGDYLKVAASQLRRAAMASKQEAEEMNKDISHIDQETSKRIDDIKNQLRHTERTLVHAEDKDQKQQLVGHMARLQMALSQAKKEHDNMKENLKRQAQQKYNQAQQLDSQAVNMEQQATQM